MATKKKRRKPATLTRELVSIYLDPEVRAAMMAYSAETGAPFAHHVRRAVADYMKKHKIKGVRGEIRD